jgi:hypothetical protein
MLDLSLVCVGLLYVLFGTLGYLFFGEDTDSVITNNLPRGVSFLFFFLSFFLSFLSPPQFSMRGTGMFYLALSVTCSSVRTPIPSSPTTFPVAYLFYSSFFPSFLSPPSQFSMRGTVVCFIWHSRLPVLR